MGGLWWPRILTGEKGSDSGERVGGKVVVVEGEVVGVEVVGLEGVEVEVLEVVGVCLSWLLSVRGRQRP